MRKCTRNVLFSAVLLLLMATTVSAELISAEGNVTQIAGVAYFSPSNASDGDPGTTWVTNVPCGADYHSCAAGLTAVLLVDLGTDVPMNGIAFWNYADSNANNTTEFNLRFATDADGPDYVGASIAYNPAFTSDVANNIEQQDYAFDRIVVARYVEVTVTDNMHGGPQGLPGGDRSGFGEIQFNAVLPDKASSPQPGNGARDIEGEVTLQWDTVVDPNFGEVDQSLIEHVVYLSNGLATDANVVEVTTIPAGSPVDEQAEFGPISVSFGETYYWRVDEITDTNTITGDLWVFHAVLGVPEILTQPESVVLSIGEGASLTVSGTNPYSKDSTGLGYQWYKVDAAGDIPVGDDLDTLTLDPVTSNEEGQYYCVVSIVDPAGVDTTVTSETAVILLKKRIGYWPFDGDAADMDYGNDGVTGNGTPDFTAEGIVNNGQAVQLVQGDQEYIKISHDALQWSPTGSFSVSLWAKVTGGTGHRAPISNRHEAPTMGFILYDEPDDTWHFWNGHGGPSGWENMAGPAVDDNQWVHLVLTMEPTGISEKIASDGTEVLLATKKLYVNGELYGEQSDLDYKPKEFGTSDLYVGAGANESPSPSFYFDGLVDDLRIYNYAIESLKVAQLYTDVQGGEVCYEKPAYDFDGDCIVSLADFAVLAVEWMECNLVPVAQCQQ